MVKLTQEELEQPAKVYQIEAVELDAPTMHYLIYTRGSGGTGLTLGNNPKIYADCAW